MKICFAASSGGHFEQLMMLKPLMDKYESFIFTEKTKYSVGECGDEVHFVNQIKRNEKFWILKMIQIVIKSFVVYYKERPDVIICTGVLAMIPMCLICKIMRKKVIYIESFAKVDSPTKTGELLYKFADRFYVQWDTMLRYYPNAKCLGGIY